MPRADFAIVDFHDIAAMLPRAYMPLPLH